MTSILDQFSDSDGNLVVPWYALVFDAIWVLMSTKMSRRALNAKTF